jgi:hypothetical protein
MLEFVKQLYIITDFRQKKNPPKAGFWFLNLILINRQMNEGAAVIGAFDS